ncbi:carbohydrate ABC transporter permease [Cohnella cholangitidis]|uniref:Carbohydrate ABC transporter permease n=1 Tax=Cohnella cholangitidis TaxID=2598458 RepID=A0A7G5C4Z1_9BACL|nr:carbohydrate ABC transporter permease [Cohnella cholangitidis]QMV44275.1 carbohydrate ABC transporter permease [Cohnella cholangitidis]
MRSKKMKKSDIAFQTVNYLFFGLFTIACIFPFYYLFINTISSNDLSSAGYVTFYPREVHFNNYLNVLKIDGLAEAAFVSIYRTVVGTLLTVAASAFLGYLFTKQDMWLRKIWYRMIIITMYFSAGLIPWYITMHNLGLTNNYLAYILPTVITPFNIILVKTFVEALPPSLEESAALDGAGYTRIFASIVVPLITPILATITIFSAVTQWNSFIDTAFLMTDTKYYTLQFLLWRYLNESTSLAALIRNSQDMAASMQHMQTPGSVRMTVTMIVVLPILIIYPFFQRFFVKGILIGAVKG